MSFNLQAFGVGSALDPNQIYESFVTPSSDGLQTLNKTVNVSGYTANTNISLGSLPAGCIIRWVSLNGYQSVVPGTNTLYSVSLSATEGGAGVTPVAPAPPMLARPPPAAIGSSINGGIVDDTSEGIGNNVLVDPATPWLVLTLTDVTALTTDSGNVNVKVHYLCP
jgi:hypothetical protein